VKAVEPAVRIYRPSVVSLVPAQLIRFLESPETVCALREAKTIMLGGAPSPAWLIEKALDFGLPIMPTYGATESCAQVTGVCRGVERRAYFTAGRPLLYRELRIAAGGTIRLGGRTLFSRYLEDSRVGYPRKNRFFDTADTGYLDSEGNLVVLGRQDGVFISGGENIHPFEIENHLLALAGIETAIVTPAPHREFGMVPWAFVEIAGPFDEAAIIADLKTRLPAYKVPKKIIRLDPQGKDGKLKYSRKDLAFLAATMIEREGA
jgi:O-succinylbenzoic acid--CoA ligase